MADFTFAHRQEGFDEHIDWSIRGYRNLLNDTISFSRYFVENNTNVVDIGCSTGKLTTRIMEYNNEISSVSNYIGVEVAEGFFDDLKNRKSELNDKYPDTSVEFIFDDIRNYEFENCSLITSLFTLQFMPKKDRFSVIQNIYDGLNEGGGFIFAEKIDCENSRIQDMLTFNYYDFKREKFTTDDIMNKEQTLRHMLKPNTWNEIHYMVEDAGFKTVEQFWRNHNFLGAIAIK
jgi:tRNA (cmo5U34)-methyltransferase